MSSSDTSYLSSNIQSVPDSPGNLFATNKNYKSRHIDTAPVPKAMLPFKGVHKIQHNWRIYKQCYKIEHSLK